MDTSFEKNWALVQRFMANEETLKKQIEELNLEHWIYVEDGQAYFENNGVYYKLCSENIEEEIKQYTRDLEMERDYLLIVFGVGNLPLLKYLVKNTSVNTKILLYEPNVYIFKYILEMEDLSDIIDDKKVYVSYGSKVTQEVKKNLMGLLGLKWENLVQNIKVISNPNYYFYDKVKAEVVKEVCAMLQMSITILGNSLEDMFNGFKNNYLNIDAFMSSNSINEVRNQFYDKPAIVVASGPSLDKNIQFLKRAENKAVILACDASLDACLKQGIKPDVLASIERDEPTYTYYYQGKTFDKDLILAGPGVLWPKIYEEFPGKTIIMSKVQHGIEEWWRSHFDNVVHINLGLSSAHVAFSVAAAAGCNPIILIGQDLAYTNDKKHSDLTHTALEPENNADESDGSMVEDINGNLVKTCDVYNTFRQWLEYQITLSPSLKVIDATEGGARIEGSEIITLNEAIDKYCVKNLDRKFKECLKDRREFSIEEKSKIYDQIIRNAQRMKKELKGIRKVAIRHLRTVEELFSEDMESMTEEELVSIIEKMQKGDRIVSRIMNNKRIISFYQQIIRQTIIFVKKLGNELTVKNIRDNMRLQMNLMVIIANSTLLVIEEFNQLQNFIENKRKECLNDSKAGGTN